MQNTEAPAGATRLVAEWAGSVRPGDLPDGVAHHARRLLVDYLAATVAGSTNPLSERLRDHLARTSPGTQATAVRGPSLTAAGAAFVNGTAAHGLEFDDGYTAGSVHPGAAIIPAVLAEAEATGAGLDAVTTAIAVAVEVTTRIARAGHPATLDAGFHNTAVAGVFGAAAGTVNLLGGGAAQVSDALGLAGSHAGGLREYHTSGNEIKRMHAGKAARDGLLCGEMAMDGLPGPDTVLEGPQGYFSAIARGVWRPEALLGGLGSEWLCLRTYIKPYPCCRHLHGAIDAALELHRLGLRNPDDIVAVRLGTYELATRFGKPHVTSLLEAQLSIPFTVASALRHGTVTLDTFSDQALVDDEVLRLAGIVRIVVDADADASYPRERPAVLTVTTADGMAHEQRVRQPLGEPDNPIDDDGLSAKFRSLTHSVIGADLAERALAAAWTGADVRPLTTDLGAANAPAPATA
ncbi:2-methylcitrate dehydratase [Acrocarpospora pleiomorpha]|uniref:2-methylcitrate dehydratase n=1 Tax=Acrocarpospora pleiomorpha TaxID=90975 RepID=A0A5M3XHK0_9ACTN|nr:MmgE/PrpD family protein [Acrocarpospora pleiomorpha]GES20714.1 2-methylcitrate dehydratase [Acrocarpospora pleiomorpha]